MNGTLSFGPPLVQPIIRLIRHSRQLVAEKATSLARSGDRRSLPVTFSRRFVSFTHKMTTGIILRAPFAIDKDSVVGRASAYNKCTGRL